MKQEIIQLQKKIDRNTLSLIYIHIQWSLSIISSIRYLFIHLIHQQGKLHGSNVILAVCNSFTNNNMPKHCLKLIHSKETFEKMIASIAERNSHSHNILIYLISLIITMGILLFFYRRQLRRDMKRDMQMQVNSAISQYYALNDSKQSHETH